MGSTEPQLVSSVFLVGCGEESQLSPGQRLADSSEPSHSHRECATLIHHIYSFVNFCARIEDLVLIAGLSCKTKSFAQKKRDKRVLSRLWEAWQICNRNCFWWSVPQQPCGFWGGSSSRLLITTRPLSVVFCDKDNAQFLLLCQAGLTRIPFKETGKQIGWSSPPSG